MFDAAAPPSEWLLALKKELGTCWRQLSYTVHGRMGGVLGWCVVL